MKSPGQFICQRVGDDVVVVQADPEIWCSAELLEMETPHIAQEGDRVTFTTSNGKWVYEITGYLMGINAYELRRVDQESLT